MSLAAYFGYPDGIRKIIYTANAIEPLNSVIRKAIERRKLFPSDQSAINVDDLAIEQASKEWSMSDRDWKSALNQFMILYENRFPINFNCGLQGIIYTLSDDNNFLLSHN